MIVWLNLDREHALEPERELRARGDGAVHARRRPRRLHRGDVRELARALTGLRLRLERRARYAQLPLGSRTATTRGRRRSSGRPAPATWAEAVGLCVRNPLHASFFVNKLWGYFIPTPPPADDRAGAGGLYVSSGCQVRPVLEAILLHPELHTGPRMVKPPVVFLPGCSARFGAPWTSMAGCGCPRPPVSASSGRPTCPAGTTRAGSTPARCGAAGRLIYGADPDRVRGTRVDEYDPTETPAQAVAKARAFWGATRT